MNGFVPNFRLRKSRPLNLPVPHVIWQSHRTLCPIGKRANTPGMTSPALFAMEYNIRQSMTLIGSCHWPPTPVLDVTVNRGNNSRLASMH